MAEPARQFGPSDQNDSGPNLRALEGGGQTSEPTGRLSAAPPSATYDDQNGDSTGPHLSAVPGGGETTAPKQGHLSAVKDGEEKGAKGPAGALGAGVAGGAALEAAGFFNPEAKEAIALAQRLKGLFSGKNKKKTLVSGGVIAGVAAVIIGAVITLLPNQAVSLMSGLENRYFAAAEHDLTKASNRLISDYIKNRIFPNVGVCGPTTNPVKFYKCAKSKVRNNGKSVADDPINGKNGLLDAWDGYDIAGQYADKGITFSKSGGKYLISSDSLPGGSIDVTAWANGKNTDLVEYLTQKSPEFATTFVKVTQSLIVTSGSFLRTIFAKMIPTRWCIMDCKPGTEQDEHNDTAANKEEFLQGNEVDRMDSAYGVVAADAETCLMDSNCDPANRQPQNNGPASNDVTAGAEKSAEDIKEAGDVVNVATKFGSAKLGKLVGVYNALLAKGADAMATIVSNALLGHLGVDMSAASIKNLTNDVFKFFGIAQWIQLIASVVVFAQQAQTKLTALNYAIHAAPFLQEFAMYAAGSDEQKSQANHPDATELGSMVSGLNAPDAQGNPSSATQSPLVRQAIDPNNPSNPTNAQIHSYLTAGHFALNGYSNILTQMSAALNKDPAFGVLAAVAKVISGVIGTLFKPINFLIVQALKLLGIEHLIASAMGALMNWLVTVAFGMPNLAHPSGEDRGTINAVGAHLGGGLAAQNIGGMALTPQQSSVLVGEQYNANRQAFESQPLFARMFATDTPYSLVSRLATDMPLGFSSMVRSSFANLLENPLGRLFGSFGSVLHPDNVFAAGAAQVEPDGVTDYGIPDSDPVFLIPNCKKTKTNDCSVNLQTYWNTHGCAQQQQLDYPNWNSTANTTLNLDNGQTEHTTTNGCLLIQRAAEAAGTLAGFTDSTGTTPTTPTPTGTGCGGTREICRSGKFRSELCGHRPRNRLCSCRRRRI